MPLPRYILFDADGTLYDSEMINYESNKRASKELHNYDLRADDFDIYVRRGNKRTYMLLEEAGHDVDREKYLKTRRRHYEAMVLTDLMTLPGLIPFLEWCSVQDIRCAVVSSMQKVQLEFALREVAIHHYFEFIVGLEDAGDKPKPDPFPYLCGIEKSGTDVERIIAVEDTDKGLASATSAGLRTYGIRNKFNDIDTLQAAEAIISSYDELRQILQKT